MSEIDLIRSRPRIPDMELLPEPCHDCAVVCNFYKEISDAFKDLSPEEQLSLSKQWYCHNVPNKACRGHADNIGIKW